MGTISYHTPVLLQKTIDYLDIKPGKSYIDATIGGGGHTLEILRRGGRVLGMDCDPEAVKYVGSRDNLVLVQGNFKDLKDIAHSNGFREVAGIIFDLGISSHQISTPERGFSFQADAPLDMRMDPNLTVTAADLINGLTKGELYELFTKLGEEERAGAIASAILGTRTIKQIRTTKALADLVVKVYGGGRRIRGKIHPATRVFQALRIAVNDELNNLKVALPQAKDLLEKRGRLVVISFHSLEDRIVKNFFKEEALVGSLQILTKKPIRPDFEEIAQNPNSRSAKLRVGEKI